MSVYLLDINLLVALLWSNHEHHAAARHWFQAHHRSGWATCPLTQAGFVRISSNPRVFPNAPSPAKAVELLEANLEHPKHRFWKDDVAFGDAIAPFESRFSGHQQTTDAYLFGLALRKHGVFATFDSGVSALAQGVHQLKSLEVVNADRN